MKFPPHWSKGQSGEGFAWGWSHDSVAEAQKHANERAARVAAVLKSGKRPSHSDSYYPDRPFREQVLQEIKNTDGNPQVIVSRNAFGCEVLNAASALFADVDLPPVKAPGLISRLLGAKPAVPGQPSPDEAKVLASAEAWTQSHPGWAWRVYRTAGGLRLLATHATFNPQDPIVSEVFKFLKVDPLYHKLCLAQNCFRARLTPKPWRVGIKTRPPEWPFQAPEQNQFEQWQKAYREAGNSFATCALVQVIGASAVHPSLQALVSLHDEACRLNSGLKLA